MQKGVVLKLTYPVALFELTAFDSNIRWCTGRRYPFRSPQPDARPDPRCE